MRSFSRLFLGTCPVPWPTWPTWTGLPGGPFGSSVFVSGVSADVRSVPSAAPEHMEISFPFSKKEAFKSVLLPTVGGQLSAQTVGRWPA